MAKDKKTDNKKPESHKEEAQEYVEAYADDQDLSAPEAQARLVCIGWKRMKALKKDNARREKGLKPQHRKVVVTSLHSAAKTTGAKKAKKAKKAKPAKKAAKPRQPTPAANGAAHASA